MSLNPQTVDPIPEQTVQVARVAFPKANIYMRMLFGTRGHFL